MADDDQYHPLSIIIISTGDSDALEKNLPAFLRQDYPTTYQVIVVADQGDHPTDDALKRVKYTYEQSPGNARLYITYIPDSSRYMSRKKLAITLGVKASENEWILLTEPSCQPASGQWLKSMAAHATDDKNLVIGYSNYSGDVSSYKRYERFYTACYLFREARHTAYASICPNLMFRKSDFMAGEGYLGSLNLNRGEYDFLVNKYARRDGTALALSPDAWLYEDAPEGKSWINQHIFYIETRKNLKRSLSHRLLFDIDQFMLRLFVVTGIGVLAFAAATGRWVLLGIAILAFIIEMIGRYLIDRHCIRQFGEQFKGVGRYDHRIMWHNIYYMIRHRFADKLEFTTHKQ